MVSCLLIDRNAGERQKLSGLMAELGFDCTELPEAADAIATAKCTAPTSS